jgi:DNA-directed RNA polymerase I, II, and III subunit RPABC1
MNIESQEIVRSFVIVKEMLSDRGLNIENLETYSENEIIELMNANTKKFGNIFQIKVNDDTKIIYHMKCKFLKHDLKKFLSTVEEEFKFKHIIFIFKEKINNNNEKNIRDLLDNVSYEVFPIHRLLFNISKHSYVPKHEILSAEEAIEIQTLYDIKNKSQFPIILKTDPVARYYDVKPGQLVKIYRSSTATGENITYRYCV